MRVLVAEHEPMCQSFLCNALSARGLHPILAVNGERAWSILQEKDAPRLAILDFRLPGVNGIEICRQPTHRDPFYTYLLLLIPNSYRLDHLLALESGADDLLAKPFNPDELSARLAIAGRILNIDDRLTANQRALAHHARHAALWRGHCRRTRPFEANEHHFRSPDGLRASSAVIRKVADQVLRKRTDIHGMLDRISWAEPFDNVEVECRAPKAKSRIVRLWGRPLPGNSEAVYELIIQDAP